jgi:hypothetical protein
MKRIFAPHLNRHVIIGACKIPDRHAPMLKLRNYMKLGVLPPAAPSCDYSGPAMSVITNIEGNDNYGDCVEAEDAHFVALVTGNAGTLYAYSAAQTLAAYSAITNFNASVPATDQGTDPIVDLNYYVQNPYADGTKLVGYLQVDATNQQEVMFAINAFGNLKIWLCLPDPYINPLPSGNGFVWDVASPDSSNGHCIGACGYNSTNVAVVGANSQGIQIMTWGLIGTLTWAAFAALCVPSAGGGCAVRVTPDWLNKSIGKTPSGFAWDDVLSDFVTMGGTLPTPAPTPTPTPSPTPPAPTSPPTCAQAQGAIAAALGAQAPLVTQATAISVANAALAALWPSP